MADLESLYEAILKGKLDVAKAVTTEAIAENVDPQEIINGYTRESGVRSLEREINKVIRKSIIELIKS